MRGYADFVPMGATVSPMRGTSDIMWTVKFRNGALKRFKFPIRTTEEGKAEPAGGYPIHEDLASQALFTEPQSLNMDAVATLKK